jgi:hypothetical protein
MQALPEFLDLFCGLSRYFHGRTSGFETQPLNDVTHNSTSQSSAVISVPGKNARPAPVFWAGTGLCRGCPVLHTTSFPFAGLRLLLAHAICVLLIHDRTAGTGTINGASL